MSPSPDETNRLFESLRTASNRAILRAPKFKKPSVIFHLTDVAAFKLILEGKTLRASLGEG